MRGWRLEMSVRRVKYLVRVRYLWRGELFCEGMEVPMCEAVI